MPNTDAECNAASNARRIADALRAVDARTDGRTDLRTETRAERESRLTLHAQGADEDCSDVSAKVEPGQWANLVQLVAAQGGERWPVLRRGERDKISTATRYIVADNYDHRCALCGSTRRLEVDHLTPWSALGSDTPDNLRLLCHDCNSLRSNYRGAP